MTSPRYERHIDLQGIGDLGQQKLLAAKVLIVGAGGLGCPVLAYLGAAGIGNMTVIDDDTVSLSNLQRQVLYKTSDIGQTKVNVAAREIKDRNPDVQITPLSLRIDINNAESIIYNHDVVVDCCDNFSTRYLLNQVCFLLKKPLISGSVIYYDGQVSTFKPWHGADNPCYQCLYPARPDSSQAPTCVESAVLGPIVGVIGTFMAVEVVKEILNIGESLSGKLLSYSGLTTMTQTIRINKNVHCKICGADHDHLGQTENEPESCQRQ